MSSQSRQTKGNRKPAPDPPANRRTPAWGQGARSSPTFSPGPARQQQQQQPPPAAASPMSFPPLSQPNGTRSDNARDRVLPPSGITGSTITLSTKSGQRYEGIVGSTTGEGDTTGVTLKDVKEVANPGAPLKDSVFIASTNIESYMPEPAEVKPTNGDSFRTDTDISQKKGVNVRGRELQAWVPSTDIPPAQNGPGSGVGDEDTFGPGANGNTPWDQFTANEQLFGVKASFDEDVYTTRLDRSAPDFKDRERKAQRLANEIIGGATGNSHIAEERGLVDDSGVNEEDKYGAVVRKPGAYVPPGARKGSAVPTTAASSTTQNAPPAPLDASADESDAVGPTAKPDPPKASANGPDGAPKAPSPVPAANKPPADPLPAFRDFVEGERHRLTQKRQALVKSEMDKRMAELVKFSLNFKLNKPVPDDLVPILAKDEDKQQRIKEKSVVDAASTVARAIGASTPATASRGVAVAGTKLSKHATPALKPSAATMDGVSGNTSTATVAGGSVTAQKTSSSSTPTGVNNKGANGLTAPKKISMVIQDIPPFRGGSGKSKTTVNTPRVAVSTMSNGPPAATGSTSNGNVTKSASPPVGTVPHSPTAASGNRLNVNATLFRPNPKVVSSAKPAVAVASAVSSPKAKESTPAPSNPFFGRPVKKNTPVHVKDDFNPFKHNKVADASQVSTLWPYNGKRYMHSYPPLSHPPAQQPPGHLVAPVHPPIPPPSYEEDSAAQAAAARGYVYAYPPYGYQPQHMMPGMGPPGPPGTYMPGPYMQPMPYPPGMPPPNVAMYNPAMGQMPPPQAYMPPPHPGAYPPPPPNGAGPRPSMPPTPIPAHAHPYYSPQMPHAYPMMMPPPSMPPAGPPHGYDGAPAPPMGGHA